MPPNVSSVKSIVLGKDHIAALVEIKGINSNKLQLFGMGSNINGQLAKDPFSSQYIDKLSQIKPSILRDKDYVIQQVECGSHHTVILIEDQRNWDGDAKKLEIV